MYLSFSRIFGLSPIIVTADNNNFTGEKVMEPKLCEVNYCPDCERACKYHPHFYNDIFRTLFLEDTEGRPVTLL